MFWTATENESHAVDTADLLKLLYLFWAAGRKQEKKMRRILGTTIFRQLVVYSLSISVIPIIIIFVLLFSRMEDMVESELNASHAQIFSQYLNNTDEKLRRYQESVASISNNTALIDYLTDTSRPMHSRGTAISEEVAKSLLLDWPSEIWNCVVYSLDEENPVYGSRVTVMEAARKEPWYTEERMKKAGWFTYYSPVGHTRLLSIVRPIVTVNIQDYTQQQLGSVKLDIDLNNLLKSADPGNYTILVSDSRGQILYCSEVQQREIFEEYLSDGHLPADLEESYVEEMGMLTDMEITIRFFFENRELLDKQREIKLLMFPVLLLVLLIVLGCACIYTRRFSLRVEALVRKFEIAETGDLTIRPPVGGNDEIAQLDEKFSHMLRKLDQLIQKEYVRELEEREARFRNLQQQINPHFLYNTLETISSMAAVKHIFPICDVCRRLGEIFRYSIGKNYGDYVTVEEELHHTQNYVSIQKMRYNQFEVFYNVEIDTKKQRMLRFLLQPVVENAIIHGLSEMTSSGTLEISIYNDADCMIIQVADDGVGMTKTMVEELNKFINSPENRKDRRKSIGVRNVNQRIKLSCGERYGLTIESEPYRGSIVILKLPLLDTEEDADEI